MRYSIPPFFSWEAFFVREPGLSTLTPLLPSQPKPGYEVKLGVRPYRERLGFVPAYGIALHRPHACTLAMADKDCRSARAGLAGTLASCFWLVSGRGNPLPGLEGLRGGLKRE